MSTATPTPPDEPAEAFDPQLTPDEVVALVNTGTMSLDAGNTIMDAIGARRMRGALTATVRVPVAVPAPDASPATMITYLDNTVNKAVTRMVWTTTQGSPDGYAIDPPEVSGPLAGRGHATVHADLRLTVTVPAYRPYRFHRTVRDLLHQDLNQLRHLGVDVGTPQRCNTDPPEDVFAYDDTDIHDFDTDVVDTFDDLDPRGLPLVRQRRTRRPPPANRTARVRPQVVNRHPTVTTKPASQRHHTRVHAPAHRRRSLAPTASAWQAPGGSGCPMPTAATAAPAWRGHTTSPNLPDPSAAATPSSGRTWARRGRRSLASTATVTHLDCQFNAN